MLSICAALFAPLLRCRICCRDGPQLTDAIPNGLDHAIQGLDQGKIEVDVPLLFREVPLAMRLIEDSPLHCWKVECVNQALENLVPIL